MAHQRVYEWGIAEVGDASAPHVVQATADAIAEFCRAARYENPVYTSLPAAQEAGLPGAVAPPAMVLALAPARLAAVAATRECALPRGPTAGAWAISLVNLSIEFQGCMLVPGDEVTSITSLENKFQDQKGRFITFRVTAHNQRGEPVVDYIMTFSWQAFSGLAAGG